MIHNTWPGTFTACGSPFISPPFLVNFLERYKMLEQMPDIVSKWLSMYLKEYNVFYSFFFIKAAGKSMTD